MISPQSWSLLCPPKIIKGYMNGFQYSSVQFKIAGHPLSNQKTRLLNHWFHKQGVACLKDEKKPCNTTQNQNNDGEITLKLLLKYIDTFQQNANLGVYQNSKILGVTKQRFIISVPSWQRNVNTIINLINWLLAVFTHYSNNNLNLTISPSLQEMQSKLLEKTLKGSNRGKFIEAALSLKIPFIEMEQQILHVGYGKRSIWLDGSFTSKTPVISSKLSKHKLMTVNLLKKNGLPVALSEPVFSEQYAVITAHKIGFPVVIKPVDLDGGIGITTDINNNKELIEAYKKASRYSQQILLEKHYIGRDYRITVLNGQSVWAVERVPGGVVGDGKHCIEELITIQNQNPNRGKDSKTPLFPVSLNAEAIKQLEKQNLDKDYIPQNKQFVRLRDTANIANGGTPTVVYKEMHPDNKKLAERAAQVLRLDLAGVDLMIPDITQSWLKAGAIICEVNAQPNLGQTTTAKLYPQILQNLVKSNGRVPIILIIGDDKLSCELTDFYVKKGLQVGHFDGSCVYHNHAPITQHGVSSFIAGQSLISNPELDMIIFYAHSNELLIIGSPFPVYDFCIFSSCKSKITTAHNSQILELFTALIPACDRKLIYTKSLKENLYKLMVSTQQVEHNDISQTVKQEISSLLHL